MCKILLICLHIVIFSMWCSAQNEPVLQPWVEVPGKVNGEQLGSFVVGMPPNSNLNYRVAITRSNSTSFYRLQDDMDTSIQLTLHGINPTFGDINGDGKLDAAFWAPGYSVAMDTVIVYWGIIDGFDTLNPTRLLGEFSDDEFGQSMCIGQIVGDSISDLVICAPNYPKGKIQGKVYIFEGGFPFKTLPSAVFHGDSLRFTLGTGCSLGDLNADGFPDIAVRGRYQVSPNRFDYVDIRFGNNVFDTTLAVRLKGPQIFSQGLAILDVNGDGKGDLLWATADSATWVNVHFGGPLFDTIPSLRLKNIGVADFGTTITNAGDVNGDGYNDIAIGCPQASFTTGFVIIYGGGTRIDGIFDAAVARSGETGFGQSISSLGDINGDGFADIIVGAPHYQFFQDKGYWGIFKGDSAIHVTAVEESRTMPQGYLLEDAYPNPFNSSTTISYRLQSSGFITLEVFDLLGKHVTTLVSETQQPGSYQRQFDASKLASGIYFYKLSAGKFSDTRKMIILK